jgi:hypothetical protein
MPKATVGDGVFGSDKKRRQEVINEIPQAFRKATYYKAEQRMDTTSRSLLEGLRESLKEEPVVKEDDARRIDQPPKR